MASRPSLLRLPPEILLSIMRSLPASALRATFSTCRLLNNMRPLVCDHLFHHKPAVLLNLTNDKAVIEKTIEQIETLYQQKSSQQRASFFTNCIADVPSTVIAIAIAKKIHIEGAEILDVLKGIYHCTDIKKRLPIAEVILRKVEDPGEGDIVIAFDDEDEPANAMSKFVSEFEKSCEVDPHLTRGREFLYDGDNLYYFNYFDLGEGDGTHPVGLKCVAANLYAREMRHFHPIFAALETNDLPMLRELAEYFRIYFDEYDTETDFSFSDISHDYFTLNTYCSVIGRRDAWNIISAPLKQALVKWELCTFDQISNDFGTPRDWGLFRRALDSSYKQPVVNMQMRESMLWMGSCYDAAKGDRSSLENMKAIVLRERNEVFHTGSKESDVIALYSMYRAMGHDADLWDSVWGEDAFWNQNTEGAQDDDGNEAE
eukprot:Colp12_sorted_trinity150504_noHs@23412